jgi:hypothetical protein
VPVNSHLDLRAYLLGIRVLVIKKRPAGRPKNKEVDSGGAVHKGSMHQNSEYTQDESEQEEVGQPFDNSLDHIENAERNGYKKMTE